jgi:bile acid-coenzyme A ligase
VTDDDRSLTRRELDELADRIARAFAASGVVTGDRVTIALRNTCEFLAAAIGCWKLGAIPAPVSWRLPGRELDAIVGLADPKVVLGRLTNCSPTCATGWSLTSCPARSSSSPSPSETMPARFAGRPCVTPGHRPDLLAYPWRNRGETHAAR